MRYLQISNGPCYCKIHSDNLKAEYKTRIKHPCSSLCHIKVTPKPNIRVATFCITKVRRLLYMRINTIGFIYKLDNNRRSLQRIPTTNHYITSRNRSWFNTSSGLIKLHKIKSWLVVFVFTTLQLWEDKTLFQLNEQYLSFCCNYLFTREHLINSTVDK